MVDFLVRLVGKRDRKKESAVNGGVENNPKYLFNLVIERVQYRI